MSGLQYRLPALPSHFSSATTALGSRRPPFANVQPNAGAPVSPPRHAEEKPKNPSSPPLVRQNTKSAPPSPPKVIKDQYRAAEYVRVGMLGEGGFARVYEVKDVRGNRLACKVVTKNSLKTKKAKTKLYAEIKIHRALQHPNIVGFNECFEDRDNVYMTLELCHNGSLMDLLRRRRRFTEPESRFFMVQILGACHYMHTHQVIHRDLKLGNLFLDQNMNVKVGDFGLAALIESPGERKKTICGTPNYIAPEVLFDTANGHSFEVDTWSVGVILYTLVVGRPPFQTKDVKAIYKRIRDNQYEFPDDRPVSSEVRELVTEILTPDPQARPSLHEILDDIWFTHGTIPASIPITAHDAAPDFRHVSRATSQANLARMRRLALLDEDQVTSINVPAHNGAQTTDMNIGGPRTKARDVPASLAEQEKEFQHAVQPGSPISALLKSARQPLVVAAPGGGKARESPLLRKLQAAGQKERVARSPLKNEVANANGGLYGQKLGGIGEEDEEALDRLLPAMGMSKREKDYEELRRKELESQKARIVAQMAPGRASPETMNEQENLPPVPPKLSKGKEKAAAKPLLDEAPLPPVPKPNSFDAVRQTLTDAFEAKAAGKVYVDRREDAGLPEEKVFIASWVDYCNKYGMGYALTDGSVGVHFNDSTTIVLSPDKHHFDYVTSRRQGSVYVRKNYTVSDYPEDLKSKVYLLKHFEQYIMDRLYGEYDYTFRDTARVKGMDFVQKYLRMKHVIVFKMSHDALQFNFYDHTKMILSSDGLMITHIDKSYNLTRWTLSEIMEHSLRPPVADPDEAKLHQRLAEKLRYCKEVLHSIRNASDKAVVGSGTMTDAGTVSNKPSKASLR